MGCYNKSLKLDENQLLKIAHFMCKLSPKNILLIGGGNVMTQTAGYKRMRDLSDDLDFITNDEGIAEVRRFFDLKKHYHNGTRSDGEVSYVNGIVVMFFYEHIKGWKIPESAFESYVVNCTSAGQIYSVPPELNIALKIRRGSSKSPDPHIYGKDALDFATIHAGMTLGGKKFNAGDFARNMSCGVCQSCNLLSKTDCLRQLSVSSYQLQGKLREEYESTIRNCSSELERHCRF